MPLGQFDSPPSADISTKDLADTVARLMKEVQYLLNGGLDTLNINEIDAKVILAQTITALQIAAGAVGPNQIADAAVIAGKIAGGVVTTAEIADAAIVATKIAAGAVIAGKIAANAVDATKINVSQLSAIAADLGHIVAGVIEAVTIYSSFISTTTGAYPRIDLSNVSNLLKAYFSATSYVSILPNFSGTPAFYFDNGVVGGSLGIILTTLVLQAISGNLQLSASAGDVVIFAGAGKKVKFDNWDAISNSLTPPKTLQQELDLKANKSAKNDFFYVSGTSGGPTNIKVTVVDGVVTSIV